MIIRKIVRSYNPESLSHKSILVRVNDELFKLDPKTSLLWKGDRVDLHISHNTISTGSNSEDTLFKFVLGADFESIITSANGTYIINWQRSNMLLSIDTL